MPSRPCSFWELQGAWYSRGSAHFRHFHRLPVPLLQSPSWVWLLGMSGGSRVAGWGAQRLCIFYHSRLLFMWGLS